MNIKMRKAKLLKLTIAAVSLIAIETFIVSCQRSSIEDSQPSAENNQTSAAREVAITFDEDVDVIPAGWMSGAGGGKQVRKFISLDGSNDCHTDIGCLKFKYKTGGDWGGIMWWPLDCGESGESETSWANVNSGTCAINLLEQGNFSSITRLTFWAKGETGQEFIEFKVGDRNTLPTPGKKKKFRLTSNWQKYEIDLSGGNLDLTRAVSVLIWVATDIQNPDGAVFYLDDIQFEGVQ